MKLVLGQSVIQEIQYTVIKLTLCMVNFNNKKYCTNKRKVNEHNNVVQF